MFFTFNNILSLFLTNLGYQMGDDFIKGAKLSY